MSGKRGAKSAGSSHRHQTGQRPPARVSSSQAESPSAQPHRLAAGSTSGNRDYESVQQNYRDHFNNDRRLWSDLQDLRDRTNLTKIKFDEKVMQSSPSAKNGKDKGKKK